jgi:hypothetical protein
MNKTSSTSNKKRQQKMSLNRLTELVDSSTNSKQKQLFTERTKPAVLILNETTKNSGNQKD